MARFGRFIGDIAFYYSFFACVGLPAYRDWVIDWSPDINTLGLWALGAAIYWRVR